jgi:hypothetical protein
VFRDKGTLGSRYDSNVTAFDPFPNDPEQRANDPLLDSIIAPTTTAMVDFVTRVVGWKVDARYQALNYDVNRLWDRNGELRQGAVTQLRQAVAIDPHLQVLIVHGWNDLSCPFMGSILTVDQMPAMGSNRTGCRCGAIRAGTCSTAGRTARRRSARMCRRCSSAIEGSGLRPGTRRINGNGNVKAGFRAGEVGGCRTRRKPVHGARWRHPWRQRSCNPTPPRR